ncbi:hypothetical protein IAR50_004407 [Cryptococcus sp. DSM 104548]
MPSKSKTEDDIDVILSAYSSDLVSSSQQSLSRKGSDTSQVNPTPSSLPAAKPPPSAGVAHHAQSPKSESSPQQMISASPANSQPFPTATSSALPSALPSVPHPSSSSTLPVNSPSRGRLASHVSPATSQNSLKNDPDLAKLRISSQTDLPLTGEPAVYTPSIISPKPIHLSPGDTRPAYPPSPSQTSLSGISPPPSPSSSSPPPRLRPEAVPYVQVKAQGRDPLVSRNILDPTLRSTLLDMHVPHQISNLANVALSGLGSGPKTRFNTTIGVPIDGLARDLKGLGWKVEGRYEAEHGGVKVDVGIVRSGRKEGAEAERIGQVEGKKKKGVEGEEKKKKEKGRKTARVEVETKGGGILIEVTEIDKHRQIDLRIETKSGDVLVLLPDNFLGPIHVKSLQPPAFLPALLPLIKPTANPYQNLHTTYMVPTALSSQAKPGLFEHTAAQQIEKYVPKVLRKESDILDQLTGGYVSHVRKGWSKVTVSSGKGRVVVGLGSSGDVGVAKGMGLRVGHEGTKDRKWWSLGS